MTESTRLAANVVPPFERIDLDCEIKDESFLLCLFFKPYTYRRIVLFVIRIWRTKHLPTEFPETTSETSLSSKNSNSVVPLIFGIDLASLIRMYEPKSNSCVAFCCSIVSRALLFST